MMWSEKLHAEQIERAGEHRAVEVSSSTEGSATPLPVVVREDDGARAVLQRKLGEPAGVHFGGIHRAAAYRRAVNGTLPRIEQQRIDGLLRLVHKPRDEIVSRSLGGIDRLVRRRLVEQVPAADLRMSRRSVTAFSPMPGTASSSCSFASSTAENEPNRSRSA